MAEKSNYAPEAEVWTIAVKRSVLDAAIQLETVHGYYALRFVDAKLNEVLSKEERLLTYEVWRYLMEWNCIGENDKAELIILPN